jgi:hypothetical protein
MMKLSILLHPFLVCFLVAAFVQKVAHATEESVRGSSVSWQGLFSMVIEVPSIFADRTLRSSCFY